jgi:hypothetical protein
MDLTFWMGILIGGFLSLATSVAGNLYTDEIREFLGRRKRLRLSNRKAKELSTHRYITELRNGDPTQTVLFSLKQTLSTRYALFGAFATIVAYMVMLLPPDVRAFVPRFGLPIFFFSMGACAIFFLLIGFAEHTSLLQTKRKLLRYADYERQIRERWGNDAI